MIRSATLAFAALLLAACGGGQMEARIGGGGTGAPLSVGIGPVTGFGSVIVNGEHYDESSATILADERPDQPAAVPTNALTLGMQLTIEHRDRVISRATAAAEVIGPVTSVGASTLTVLKQTVIVRPTGPLATAFDGFTSLNELAAGARIEVHGQRNAGQEIVATLLRLRESGAPLRVAGTVGSLAQGSFRIGGLTISTSQAAVIPASQLLANGVRAVVWTDQPLANGTLAARVIRIGGPVLPDTTAIDLEGAVTTVLGSGRFTAAATTIDATTASFVNGSIGNLASGQVVRVRGSISAGVLRAARVEFVSTSSTTLAGPIGSFSSVDQTFKVRGTAARVTAQTTYNGGGAGNLDNGVSVTLEGPVSMGIVEAQKLTFQPVAAGTPQTRVGQVVGEVVDIAGGKRFRLDGVEPDIRTTAQTQFQSGTAAELASGRKLRVRAQFQGTELLADHVHFLDNPAQPQRVELEGVARDVQPGAFKVDGRTVVRNASTRYLRDGAAGSASDLVDGVRVEVVARKDANVLTAIDVDVQSASGEQKVRGLVSGRTPADAVEFRVDTQRVSVAFNPQVIPANRTLADIRNGDDIEVTGTLSAGVLRATRVKFR